MMKNFYKKIIKRTEKIEEQEENIPNKSIKEVKEKFLTEIKVDNKVVDKVIERENFLKRLQENDDELELLSVDRLQKLTEYYDSIIKENDEKIKRLKATV